MGMDTEIRFWGGASIWPLRMISLLKGNHRKLSKRMPALFTCSLLRAMSKVPGTVRGAIASVGVDAGLFRPAGSLPQATNSPIKSP